MSLSISNFCSYELQILNFGYKQPKMFKKYTKRINKIFKEFARNVISWGHFYLFGIFVSIKFGWKASSAFGCFILYVTAYFISASFIM